MSTVGSCLAAVAPFIVVLTVLTAAAMERTSNTLNGSSLAHFAARNYCRKLLHQHGNCYDRATPTDYLGGGSNSLAEIIRAHLKGSITRWYVDAGLG
ncbi:unnamed protein product [Ceratitis capitata]|uniref:(Mediterranean fruit fly) hypothetical protein n=1 Tax=Ceratitis capitata TaxID=7213 RepID=A0A811U7C5_CERCA|nr:unnamed protein product [Ceratitis capitata]